MAKSGNAARRREYTLNVRAGEIVPRGRPIEIGFAQALHEEARRGITLAGQRIEVRDAGDGRSFVIDTAALAPGSHRLRLEDLWAARGGKRMSDADIAFEVIDTSAPLPRDCVVLQAARLRIGELEVERLPMNGRGEGAWLDVFKAVHRKSGERMELAFDEAGRKADLERELRRLAQRRHKTYGAVHPTLHEALRRRDANEPVEVAIWLQVPESPRTDKPARGRVRRRPASEEAEREQWRALGSRFAETARRHGFELARIDAAAPVLYGRMPAGRVAALAAASQVAAVFLHEPQGFDDLGNAIAIANSDDAQADGFTGAGINVAVYERGPDDTTNLAITARFDSDPDTSQHSRHVHGIIRNTQRRAPNGHAPGCNLHSANSYDLDAIRWAAEDRGCTVISQSFHRDSEQTASGLSFDDIYKDHLALRWPYPTICEAAGNGTATEYVNHKGYNRLTVGNHNDAASGMAGDSVFRNPASSHGDRELPEIAANGMGVTAVGLTLGGTSMAAPAAAGAAALIQQANATLQSWPEGCRAILMAAAWRNPAAGTWWADVIAGVDAADGAGALDAAAAVRIARSRRLPNGAAASRGWDVGTLRSADVDADGYATYLYRVSAPRTLLSAYVKVVLAWDAKATTLRIPGFPGLSIALSYLSVDLDLEVRDASGATVAWSSSWDNSYEIAEFAARRGQTYEIRIRRWSGSDDVWFGLAWNVTGPSIVVALQDLAGMALGDR